MSNPKAIVFGPLPPPHGGVAVLMVSIKDACFDSGAEVWSYAGNGGDERVERVNHRMLGHIWRVMRIRKKTPILDSTHFHLEYPHWLLLPMWLLAKRLRSFVWIKACHDGSLPFRFDDMPEAAKRRIARAVAQIDRLIVSSEGLVAFFREQFGVTATYISPLMPLPRGWTVREGAREDSPEGKVVTSIGAFIPSYGFDHVAQAVERLRGNGSPVTLTLLDGGFAKDDEYKRDVLVDRPWITVHENVPHNDVSKFLAGSDAFVRAFAHESYGLSRVEAIMCGVPVIATNIGETRGMWTYDFGDIDMLSKLLESSLAGAARADLAHWQEVYAKEAEADLAAYIDLIAGEPHA